MSILPCSFIYVLLCITTSVLVCYLGRFDISDAPFVGLISILSPIALPIILLGVLGAVIHNYIEDRFSK